MSQIRFYFDEDAMEGGVVSGLRSRGIDVHTAADAGMQRRPDEDCLAFAALEGRCLYTFNIRDFYRIHAEWMVAGRHHSGLVLCRQERFPIGGQIRRLLRLTTTRSAEEMRDRVEFLADW